MCYATTDCTKNRFAYISKNSTSLGYSVTPVSRKKNFEETVIDIISKRKLRLFGHICRMPSDRLLKTPMLGMVEGERQQGRRALRWIDDILMRCHQYIKGAVQMTEDHEVRRRFRYGSTDHETRRRRPASRPATMAVFLAVFKSIEFFATSVNGPRDDISCLSLSLV